MRIKQIFSKAQIIGSSTDKGITTVLSGTRIASVTATAARSGAAIQITPLNYLAANSANINPLTFGVFCTAAGYFQVVTVGSEMPKVDCPIAWTIIR